MQSKSDGQMDAAVLETIRRLGGKASTNSVAAALDCTPAEVKSAMWRIRGSVQAAKMN